MEDSKVLTSFSFLGFKVTLDWSLDGLWYNIIDDKDCKEIHIFSLVYYEDPICGFRAQITFLKLMIDLERKKFR